jgi:hypothetical protein
MKNSHPKRPAFHVGDFVQFPWGSGKATATVVEDRGPIGVNGGRLYRIRLPMDPFEPEEWEMPEDHLEPALDPRLRASELTKPRIIAYLKNGGLRRMLRVETPHGQYQPRAWLKLTDLDNVTYTFAKERGFVGGGTVPYDAIWGDRIRTSKVNEVVEFLEHFGLTRDEAEQIIREIGTAKK